MERIHVSVRSRPISMEDAMKSPWKIFSDSIFMHNHYSSSSSSSFRFDRIFREDSKTTQVYETRTKDIVAAAIRGFNEKERIALELDEEKKAQAQMENVLQEQAKRIENPSSTVTRRKKPCESSI